MDLPDIRNTNVKGKRFFLRMDLDAPLSESRIKPSPRAQAEGNQESRIKVADDTRLVVGMPTLKYLLDNGAKVVVGGHVRRPDGYDPKLSVKPVVEWMFNKFKVQSAILRLRSGQEFKIEEAELNGFKGWRLSENLFVLENLRFYKEEKEGPSTSSGLQFTKSLANLADIYVNEAFASSHRSHASIVGIPKFLPHFAGFHLKKEIEVLSSILENPTRPLVVIVGGEKIETKLPLLSKMCQLADNILVGGKIAQEILLNPQILQKNTKKIRCAFLIANINKEGTDITKESIDNFIQIINMAKTIVWNGPVGLIRNTEDGIQKAEFSEEDSEYGTWRLAEAIVKSKACTIAGGGDTLEFLKRINLLDKFSFFSTGGGAMLSFLSGEKLPGIEALIH